MTPSTPTSGAADLRTTFREILVDLPNTAPFTIFKAGFDAALAAGQATAAQAVVPALTEAQIASACLSYRHDFGLLGETDRKSMMWIARQWERAFAKEREFAAPAQPAAQQPDIENLRKALQFYADGEHFIKSDGDAWDTVSGEPQNYWCDEAGTATVEDGSIAKLALEGHTVRFEDDTPESAQQGVVYAALPRPYSAAAELGLDGLFTEDHLHEFADRTHAIRVASHGHAPAQPDKPDDLSTTTDEDLMVIAVVGLNSARFRIGKGDLPGALEVVNKARDACIEAGKRASNATPSPQAAQQAPAGAAQADSVQEDAARLREALTVAVDHIDMAALRISHCKDAALIDAARAAQKEGEKP